MNVKYLKVIIFGLAMGFWVYTKLDTPTSNHTSAFEGFSYERSAFSHKTKVEVDHDIEYVRDLLTLVDMLNIQIHVLAFLLNIQIVL